VTKPALESPDDPQDLYLARGDDIPAWRPLNTGDVFAGVPLTIGGERTGRAIVLTHPCTIRIDGVHLIDRLLMAPVEPADPVPMWRGHYAKMPLPALEPGDGHAADFDRIEPVASMALDPAARLAALQPVGVNLLLQQLVHYLTRVVIETSLFNVACGPGFAEVDLIEEWLEVALDSVPDLEEATVACHDWLRSAPDGSQDSPQRRLTEPQQRAAVRREARAQVRAWLDARE
jgi:hypothetical protein